MAPPIGLNNRTFQPCPNKPNAVSSMAPQDDAIHYIQPINYGSISTDKAKEKLHKALKSQQRTRLITENDHYIHLTFKTPLMRFTDDIEFYFPDDEPIIHMRSASRIGYSDWGTNRKRLEAIRSAFETV